MGLLRVRVLHDLPLSMITNANALQSSLAHLLASEPGHRISMDAKIQKSVSHFPAWAISNEIEYEVKDGKLTLWRKV